MERRWLILTQYYYPEIGAPQIRLRSLARELRKYGIAVEVLTALPNYPAGKILPGYEGKVYLRELIDDVPVRRTWIFAGTGRSKLIRLLNYFSFTLTALIATLFSARPDLIFVESQPLSLGVVAVLMKWLRGVPYIYNVPDLQIDVAKQMGFMSSGILLKFAAKLEDLFLRQSWKVSTVTHEFIRHFQQRGLSSVQISFLPNGADTEFLRPCTPAQTLLDRWGLHGKKVFLYVGTHAYYHGLETLIEAAELLRDEPDIAFLLVGDGPERTRLKEIAASKSLANVHFGQSPYDEMDQLYSIAYASVATLRNLEVAKSMRLSKIFPSLSCAVPVIYSGVGEAADLLVRNSCGIAVAPESAAALATSIKLLAENPKLRMELGQAGREFVQEQYSWSTIVRQWLKEIGVDRTQQRPAQSKVRESLATR